MVKNTSHGGARKGAGRKKGSAAPHTLKAQTLKENLIAMYEKEAGPINRALLNKAKEGDISAIKELYDRVFGKSMQPISADVKARLQIAFDSAFNDG